MQLGYGLTFQDLYTDEGLQALDQAFLDYLSNINPNYFRSYQDALSEGKKFINYSQLIMDVGKHLEEFIGKLFNLTSVLEQSHIAHRKYEELYKFKRNFIQRSALKKYKLADIKDWHVENLITQLNALDCDIHNDYAFMDCVNNWLLNSAENETSLDLAMRYAAWQCYTPPHPFDVPKSPLFTVPHPVDASNLVSYDTRVENGITVIQTPTNHVRARDGFALTDPGLSRNQALDQAHYCIICHHRDKDSCSKGLFEKKNTAKNIEDPIVAKPAFAKDSFALPLTGCPLEQKISEMNSLKREGYNIAALAVAMIDNPMIPATGHRICNDCVKSCIFQAQDPVDVPGIETEILKEVLSYNAGLEIYSLLTKWNPLKLNERLPQLPTGRKILVVGMGPAGFTLAHYLLNEGHTVVGIDGLKIEPLPEHLVATPIKDIQNLYESLDDRVISGFGGVAEYGITIRWDKNLLKIIRLTLERRKNFRLWGSVRLGSTLTLSQAFEMGFDHIALCLGAGSPYMINLKNSLAPGLRQASDFLMALQLTGAAKKNSLSSLQIRMPILVIGGGLTAIDTATEAGAYYIRQVEQFKHRYEENLSKGKSVQWNTWEEEIAHEFLDHADLVMQERQKAALENRKPNFQSLLKQWGGVKVVYRRRLVDSPSYQRNHLEIQKALEEGIEIVENASPLEIGVDDKGLTTALDILIQGEKHLLPARTILVAAGIKPNTVLAQEDEHGFLQMDGIYFQAISRDRTWETRQKISPEPISKPENNYPFAYACADGKGITFFGDLHPSYSGSVVKAMASAKNGYQQITKSVLEHAPKNTMATQEFFKEFDHLFTSTVQQVTYITPEDMVLEIYSPHAARNFSPGQLFRLQPFETKDGCEPEVLSEGIPLTGFKGEREGLLKFYIKNQGASTASLRWLKPGQKISLMGPVGSSLPKLQNKKIFIIGDKESLDILINYARSFDISNEVKIFIKVEEDKLFEKNIPSEQTNIEIILISDLLKHLDASMLEKADYIFVSANSSISIKLQSYLTSFPELASKTFSTLMPSMQCMMKGICGQCICKVDNEKLIYGCGIHIYSMAGIDFSSLEKRTNQNNVVEKLIKVWSE